MSYESAEDRITNAVLDETILHRKHETGLSVFYCPRPGNHKKYSCFATDFGSIDLQYRDSSGSIKTLPAGIAHFLEHKLFEQPSGVNAFDEFARLGASSNAYTSYTTTNYLFSCSQSYYENLEILIDFVETPYFTDENVEKEQGIIGEEIRMYADSPDWRLYTEMLRGLYHSHPAREDILGTEETIAKIDKETLFACHDAFYRPSNMVLFTIGDLDSDEYFRRVDEILADRATNHGPPVERIDATEPESVHQRRIELEMMVSIPRLSLGFKESGERMTGRDLLAREQATDLALDLVFGRSTDLHQSLYRDQLIDDGFGAHHSAHPTFSFSIVGGETPDPAKLEARVLEALDAARKNGLSTEDFERRKRATMGQFYRDFSSLEVVANHFCGYRFHGIDAFDVVDVLRSLTVNDLESRLRDHLTEDRVTSAVLRPTGKTNGA